MIMIEKQTADCYEQFNIQTYIKAIHNKSIMETEKELDRWMFGTLDFGH